MKRFNMKTLSLISSLSSLALLMACGDNVTDNDPVTTQAYASQDEFPECEESGEGYFALVRSTNDLYICTASEWVNISKASAGGSAKPGCSSEELENGKGVKIICNGDSVAVLNYGTQGEEGDKGGDGHKGETGDKGEPGSSTNGKNAVWDTDRCKLKNTGSDVIVFDCGDSVYVKSFSTAEKANLKTWNALNFETRLASVSGTLIGYIYTQRLSAAGSAEGSIVRWTDDNSWSNGSIVSETELKKNFAIAGTATLDVKENATVYSAEFPLEPLIAVRYYTSNAPDISTWGGFCLTYKAEKDMERKCFNVGCKKNIKNRQILIRVVIVILDAGILVVMEVEQL